MGQNVLIIALAAVIALVAIYSLFALRRKWAPRSAAWSVSGWGVDILSPDGETEV